MAENINIALVDEIKRQAYDRLMEINTALIDSTLGADGATFGDEPLNRGDRILRFQDLAQRGVLDVLKTMSPPTYKLLVTNYVRDVANSPLIAGV